MAVLECNLLFTSRGGQQNLQNVRTYTRVYEVITDDPNDDEQVVGNDPGIPVLGTSLDGDDDAVVVNIDCQQSDDSDMLWYVTVDYDSNPPTPDAAAGDEHTDLDGNPIAKELDPNPLNEPATWGITFDDSEEPVIEWIEVDQAGNLVIPDPDAWTGNTVYKRGAYVVNAGDVYICVSSTGDQESAAMGGPVGQANGQIDNDLVWNFYASYVDTQTDPNWAIRAAVLNSGMLPFDPPAMAPVSRPVLKVTKNMPEVALEYLMEITNSVNFSTWRGIPPRCAKIKSATADGGGGKSASRSRNGIGYVTINWEIALNPDTWDLRLLDQGYGYLQLRTPEGGGPQVLKFFKFKDANGDDIDQPVLLNGAGSPLEPEDPPVFRRGVPRQIRILEFSTVLPF